MSMKDEESLVYTWRNKKDLFHIHLPKLGSNQSGNYEGSERDAPFFHLCFIHDVLLILRFEIEKRVSDVHSQNFKGCVLHSQLHFHIIFMKSKSKSKLGGWRMKWKVSKWILDCWMMRDEERTKAQRVSKGVLYICILHYVTYSYSTCP